MKIVLYMHGGSGNHGCEAIIRTSSKLLGGPQGIKLWSFSKEEDYKYGAATCFEEVVASEEIKRFSFSHLEAWIKRNVYHDSLANMRVFLRDQFKNKIAVSVGGDNYCYPWSAKQAVEYDDTIRKYASKMVLWGCSIDAGSINDDVKEDLRKFDLITAREQESFELLKEINPNTLKVADPAFLLETESLSLPEGFLPFNTVGINISPMVGNYVADRQIIVENYRTLMGFIINQTKMNICLIPHVVWSYNNDFDPIMELYNEFKESSRVCYIPDANCMQLKSVISQCRFFVGARTHATIASYSSLVPTLVVGYSIKSIGIARDLFGTEENYVVSVQDMTSNDDLLYRFKWMVENEAIIADQLKTKMPRYKKCAMAEEALRIIKSWG